jgi:hypothetical protein
LSNRFLSTGIGNFLVANVLVLGVLAYAFVLESANPDFYYLSVQEDEYLEWSSFWAFLFAAVAYFRRAIQDRRTTRHWPWFFYGIALFCLVVAMEEISWGQRLFGYRPPVYFLEHNYQQEFNFHNVVETDYRKLALMVIIAGYGIVLPLAAQFPFLNIWFRRVGIVAPTMLLLPAYAATILLYVVYPWSHSGEWVELMLGLSILFSALLMPRYDSMQTPAADRLGATKNTTIAFIAVVVLGLVSGVASRVQQNAHPENLQAAQSEVEAIARDFDEGLAESDCNLHKRVYTFVEDYEQYDLYDGSFADLVMQGMPAERADFFLDPWNSPYWIRDRCVRQTGERIMFVYSFGPNRRRESTRTEILGDDIGAHIAVD